MKGKEEKLKGSKKVANYNLQNQDSKHKQSQKGITLVALVVTIVVLLILAGVTIMMLFGENGIIKKAEKAKEETRYRNVNDQVQLWKIDWKTYNLVGNSNTPLEEEEFIESLLSNKLVNEDEIDRDNKTITIASKEIDYKLNEQTPEEIVISDLSTSIVTSDTTSSKLRVQVQKPEGIGEDVEYTYTIKKKDSDETVIQTTTDVDTSCLFESLEPRTDYVIEASTSNINGTIYRGSCEANTYRELSLSLGERISRDRDSIQCIGGKVYTCYGGPRSEG